MRLLPLIVLTLGFGSGCAAQRLTLPPAPPPPVEAPVDLTSMHIAIKSFEVTNRSSADMELDTRARFRSVFTDYLRNAGSYGLLRTHTEHFWPDEHVVMLDVLVRVEE